MARIRHSSIVHGRRDDRRCRAGGCPGRYQQQHIREQQHDDSARHEQQHGDNICREQQHRGSEQLIGAAIHQQ